MRMQQIEDLVVVQKEQRGFYRRIQVDFRLARFVGESLQKAPFEVREFVAWFSFDLLGQSVEICSCFEHAPKKLLG